MRQSIIFVAVLLCVSQAFAQPGPDTLWTHTYGGSGNDRANSIQQTTDGGYVIAGYTNSFGAGGADCYVVMTDAQGDTVWTRTYGGSGDDWATSIQQTTDGGYVIAGSTVSGAGLVDFCVVKTNAEGDTLWTRTYGWSDWDWAYSIRQTTDGGYVVAGVTYSVGAGLSDFWVVKTNTQGDTLWSRTYGGSGNDDARSIQQTSDGGYVIAGWTDSFGAGNSDFYVVKTNAQGDTLWTRTYGGSYDDAASSIQQTTDGGYVIAGYTDTFGAADRDFYVVRTDGLGNPLWTRTYGGSGDDAAVSIQQTTDGGFVVAGTTSSFGAGLRDFYVVKTGPDASNASQPHILHPSSFSLSAFPNPFNPATQIVYSLPKAGRVSLTVSNLLGQKVAALVDGIQAPGTHIISFDGSAMPSGVYLYRLEAGELVQTKKMVLLK